MTTTNPRSNYTRPLSYDEIQVLVHRGHVERSQYVVDLLRHAVNAVRRRVRWAMRRLTSPERRGDLSGRAA